MPRDPGLSIEAEWAAATRRGIIQGVEYGQWIGLAAFGLGWGMLLGVALIAFGVM